MPQTITTLINIMKDNKGKIRVSSVVAVGLVFLAVVFFNFSGRAVYRVMADDVTTSVTVLNTPPQWQGGGLDAEEDVESSTTNPTNSESNVAWVATANDSSDEDYYLLICKTSDAPTANAGAAPTCGGGDENEWAVSAATTDETEASTATTTQESWAQSNAWYAWVCDGNTGLPRCNTNYRQGNGSTASPFVVNHRPIFEGIGSDSPKNPGQDLTWTANAYDTDDAGGQDTVKLFVCKTNSFSGDCESYANTWATSTFSVSDPAAVYNIDIPTPDDDYDAYVFMTDSHGHTGTTTQGTNSAMTVNNVAPDFSGQTGTIDLTDGSDPLNLTMPQGTTTFNVTFTVNDNNSCQNVSSGDEMVSAVASVYRSGITQAGCSDASDYNANNCYAATSTWASVACSQDAGSCDGIDDPTTTWTCTTTLWYIADPTDGASATDSTWWGETWLTSVQVTDDDGAKSAFTETTDGGTELTYLVGYDVSSANIPYDSLEPGQDTGTLNEATDLIAIGNVGLDEDLYGDSMCTTWTAPDSCPVSASSTIPVSEQQYATSSLAYGSGTSLSGSQTELEINVKKTISTSSPMTLNTNWGINIPGTITLAGNYFGQNTIIAKKGEAQYWDY